MRIYKILFSVCFLCGLLLTGCGTRNQSQGMNTYHAYFVNKTNTKVVMEDYETKLQAEDTENLLNELLGILGSIPKDVEVTAPLAGNFRLVNYTLKESQLNLDFDDKYKEQTTIQEILNRAAIVRTLTQIQGIDTVTFSVAGEALTDPQGLPIGTMNADFFIDNAGTEINAYEKARLHLYFADSTGDGLVEVDRQQVVYSSNISMERLVVEELIKGPNNGETFPTINPATKVLGVTVKDGVCYVNLSGDFLTQIYNVTSDVTIYSITNSLAELTNVNKVQISVNGETNVTYRESTSLTTIFERNLDIVDQPE